MGEVRVDILRARLAREAGVRQHTGLGDYHCVLKLGRRLSILRDRRPAIGPMRVLPGSHVDHRLRRSRRGRGGEMGSRWGRGGEMGSRRGRGGEMGSRWGRVGRWGGRARMEWNRAAPRRAPHLDGEAVSDFHGELGLVPHIMRDVWRAVKEFPCSTVPRIIRHTTPRRRVHSLWARHLLLTPAASRTDTVHVCAHAHYPSGTHTRAKHRVGPTDAVSAIGLVDGEACAIDVLGDDGAEVAIEDARAARVHRLHQGIMRCLDEILLLLGHIVPHAEGFVEV